jgi:hypothetical protein
LVDVEKVLLLALAFTSGLLLLALDVLGFLFFALEFLGLGPLLVGLRAFVGLPRL